MRWISVIACILGIAAPTLMSNFIHNSTAWGSIDPPLRPMAPPAQPTIAGFFKRSPAKPKTGQPRDSNRPVCPQTLPNLTAWMLQDLPSYANRVRQRSWSTLQRQTHNQWQISNMILAGRAEFEPLPAEVLGGFPAQFPPGVQQVFFTTLERSYWTGANARASLSTSYHWLFLTQTTEGWQFIQLITRMGKTVSAETALPPRDSSYGVIAQGMRQWLQDCQTGNLQSQPPAVSPTPSPNLRAPKS